MTNIGIILQYQEEKQRTGVKKLVSIIDIRDQITFSAKLSVSFSG